MPYTPIVATLGYLLSPDGTQVLMIHRNARPGDQHLGKYNGLGGKMEPDEDVLACMRREIREEAGVDCGRMQLRGTISWPGFGKQGEDWLGFVFLIHSFEGTPHTSNWRGRWSGSRSSGWIRCRCGKATAISCRWYLMATRARSTASCRIATGACSRGHIRGSDRCTCTARGVRAAGTAPADI